MWWTTAIAPNQRRFPESNPDIINREIRYFPAVTVVGVGGLVSLISEIFSRMGMGIRGAEEERAGEGKGISLGKYEVGRTLGEGRFGKVKLARNVVTGEQFAIKILDKNRIHGVKIDDQIKREIGTLKLLRHPNIVRLYEVLASKTKIYMVLEYVNGGELFDKIALKGRFREEEARRLFQQIIDSVSYFHDKGVYHRDLKLENILVDSEGNIKISDFGLSALPQHLGKDGLLHTTCGSPSYVAPEVLTRRGYDGALSDIWSCGVILYVLLTGYLPFDDRNRAVLYQKIFKGDVHIPKRLSPGAKNMIKRILDPNPKTRLDIEGIKSDDWFMQSYVPTIPDDEKGIHIDNDIFLINEPSGKEGQGDIPCLINAFQLIGMSSSLDLSGFFEKEDASQRKVQFASNHCSKDSCEKIEDIAAGIGFHVQKRLGKLKLTKSCKSLENPGGPFSVSVEVFELSPYLSVVELSKSHGDSSRYRELCSKLSKELGICESQPFLTC